MSQPPINATPYHGGGSRSPAIVVADASRKYSIFARPSDRLKARLLGRALHRDHWALRDVSFAVEPGITLGIVGTNGSGKSTLLQLLAGVLHPTLGRIAVTGRVAAILELGAGFNPEFTGRENALLNGAILGLPESVMQERVGAIEAFADIGEFFDQPIRTYSSGMYVRLAFAVATQLDADVLLVDEALAVGDAYFQHKCMRHIHELQDRGVTIVLVSHDTAAVTRLCHRAIWLDQGRLVADGAPADVVPRYLAAAFGHAERSIDVRPARRAPVVSDLRPPTVKRRFGDGRAEIVGIGLRDDRGQDVDQLRSGEPWNIHVQIAFHQAVPRPIVGQALRDDQGNDLASTNTALEGMSLPPAAAGDSLTVRFRSCPPPLRAGVYTFVAAVADGDLHRYVVNDWIDEALTLTITSADQIAGLVEFPVTCSWRREADCVGDGYDAAGIADDAGPASASAALSVNRSGNQVNN